MQETDKSACEIRHGGDILKSEIVSRAHMGLYTTLKRTYRALLPARVRTILWQNRFTRRPREWLLRRAERLGQHNEIYNTDYFVRTVDPIMAMSADAIADDVVAWLHPQSVVDVGCGTGGLMVALKQRGVKVFGMEYSEAAIAICRDRGLSVTKFDIEKDSPPAQRADLVISTEVAEHLPPSCADRFVDLLAGLAPAVVLTAAVPGMTGTDHVNEQPNEYWIAKFKERGFEFDRGMSHAWRASWQQRGVADCYWKSAMVFHRQSSADEGQSSTHLP
jgi:SAM-dependent methyltransferase